MEARELYMREALREAEIAASIDEVPIGAVIVRDGEIIARAHNRVEIDHSSNAHAEMLAIARAEEFLDAKWLTDCEMYVTLEPCAMCAGAMVLARIGKLYIGAMDAKNGACGSIFNVVECESLNHFIDVERGVLAEECGEILSKFFREMRAAKALRKKLRREQ